MRYIQDFNSIRSKYVKFGVDNYYSNFKNEYSNPHLKNVENCLDWVDSQINIGYFLDLGCGKGEVSNYLKNKGLNEFKGLDPYFFEIYEERFNKKCYNLKYEDLAISSLGEKFNSVISSYSLHLCPKSYYEQLLYSLSCICNNLVIISPSKYPIVNSYFTKLETKIINRTHCSVYINNILEK